MSKFFSHWGVLWLACFSISMMFGIFAFQNHLHSMIYPDGDLAADMLLTNTIGENGYLLTGHYSRFQFNHPGPFFFYFNYFIEQCFGTIFKYKYNIWVFGSIFFNSLLLSLASVLIANVVSDEYKLESAIIVLLVLLILYKNFFIHQWMPFKLISPFLVFVILTAISWHRKAVYLPFTVLFASILIHGYVTLPLFTLPLIFIGFIVTYRKSTKVDFIRNAFFSALVLLLMFSHVLIDFVGSDVSNIEKIFNAMESNRDAARPTWEEVFVILKGFWTNYFGFYTGFLALSTAFAITIVANDRHKWFLVNLFIIEIVITAIFLIYYKTVPAPLMDFMAMFYAAMPIIIITVLSISIIRLFHMRTIYFFVIGILVIFTINLYKQNIPLLNANTNIGDIAGKLAFFYRDMQISYDSHEKWPLIAGVLLELEEKKIHACTTLAHMSFLFTRGNTCRQITSPNVKIIDTETCMPHCGDVFGSVALVYPKLKIINQVSYFDSSQNRLYIPRLEIKNCCNLSITLKLDNKKYEGNFRLLVDSIEPVNIGWYITEPSAYMENSLIYLPFIWMDANIISAMLEIVPSESLTFFVKKVDNVDL